VCAREEEEAMEETEEEEDEEEEEKEGANKAKENTKTVRPIVKPP
jgi:hypothetical protein